MTRRMRLSDRNVSRLRVEKVEYAVWDTRICAGLGVRVRPLRRTQGAISACLSRPLHDGSSKRRSLGPVRLMDVDTSFTRAIGAP